MAPFLRYLQSDELKRSLSGDVLLCKIIIMHTISQKLKSSLLIAGVLLTCGMAQAQSSGKTDSTQHRMHHWGPRNSSSFGHGRHGNGIHYTPEQRRQLMAINKEYHDKSADLFKKDNITLKEYKASLVALQKDRRSKTEALLTPQQKEQTARRKKMAEENRQVAEAARLERLKLRLKLSDDQVSKLKAGEEGLRTQMRSIHENDNLLAQEKREQMKGLMAKRKDVFKSVLTPEQFTQFEQMREHRRGFGREGHEGKNVTAI
jgi:Spy/CpxP family protein refolding chaperone